jgi:small subunit ribosomal protein S16
MVKLRLQRFGKRNHATFRLVAIDSHKAAKGKAIEHLGSLDPHLKKVVLKVERIKYWLSVGADASRTVRNLLITKGVLKGKKIKITMKSKQKEEAKDKTDKAKTSEVGKKVESQPKKAEEKSKPEPKPAVDKKKDQKVQSNKSTQLKEAPKSKPVKDDKAKTSKEVKGKSEKSNLKAKTNQEKKDTKKSEKPKASVKVKKSK